MKQYYSSSFKRMNGFNHVCLKKVLKKIIFPSFLIYATLFISNTAFAQQGMLGAKTVTTANVILNEFTTLAANAASGATSITVGTSALNTNGRFSGNLAVGELVLIIQMKGATMSTAGLTNSINWGAITSYNSAGLFEFDQVGAIPNATTITFVTPLKNSYTSTGNVEVVRVPRYTTLTINAGASLATDAWDGSTGGVLALEMSGATSIAGTIDVSGIGFAGGTLKELADCCPHGSTATRYATTANDSGAAKGEGIGGDSVTYDALGGRYGRGAPANGGGGGSDHNSGGGGGSNSGNGVAWNGLGNPDTTTVPGWIAAWDLEGGSFHTNVSSGGGRGGYSYASNNPNPLTVGPGNSSWGGDYRENVGGLGGRPLDNTGNRVFMGGGGGAGDANDGYGSAGANGGGIVYLISGGNVSGGGTINANGASAVPSLKYDAPGGGGGGGSVVIYTTCASISNLTINATGGTGGNQAYPGNKKTQESEGPGGGGGGGYVSTTNANSLTINISGGANGTTNSSGATAFIPNGATKGGSGNNTLNPVSPYSDGSGAGSPSVSVLPLSPAYCTGGSALLTASGATTYSWSPAIGLSATTGIAVTANPTTTTTYTITGSNGSGCTNTFNVTVTVNPVPAVSVLPVSPSICAGNSVNLNASGGNAYTWSPSSGLSSSSGDSVTANPSATATYTVTGTSVAGCSNTSSVTVTVHSLPTVTALPLDSTICNGTIVPLNAGGAITYAWSPSTGLSATTGTSVNANPSSSTSYTVTGTDVNGCSNTASLSITVNALPTVLVNPATPVICNGTSVVLNASGASAYTWSPSSGLSASSGTSVTANPSVTSTYTITGTSGSGCSSSASVTVTVLSALTITVTPPTPAICTGKSTSLTASGANSFTWSPSTGLSSASGSTVTANPTSTTTYKVVGTAGTCSDSTNVTITVNQLPSISILPLTPTICNGQMVSLNVSGGSTYAWSPSSGLSTTSGASVNADPTTTSSYVVTGTDENGCSNTSSVTVTVNQLPVIAVLPTSPSICIGQSILLNASGGDTYIWSPSSGLSATSGSSVNANPSSTASYMVTGTDGNGCSNTASVTVTVNLLPSVEIAPPTPAICAGQFITLDGKGANTYSWSPSTGLSATTGTFVNASPTSTSTYTVTGTDGFGCTNTASTTVTVNALPTVGVLPASPSICNGQSVSLTANGANNYIWSPSAGLSATSGMSVTANPSGTSTYTVIGTDANGCTNTANATVTVHTLPAVGVLPASPSICNGQSVSLTASGANTYSWSPSTGLSATTGTSVNANPSGNSTYIVTGTDGFGCTNTASAAVTVNALPTVGVLPASPAICNGQSVSLTANGANTYSWSPSTGLSATTGTSVNANPSGSSTYIVTGTDGFGCTNTASTTVTVNALPTVGVLPATPSICNGQSVSLTASGANNYIWSPSSGLSATTGTSVNANPSSSSSYTVTGTDGNGCTNTAGVSVTVNPLPTVGVLPTSPAICTGQSVSLTATGANAYSWSPSLGLSATTGTSVNASPSGNSTYTVTGTDGFGCTNTASAIVTVHALPTVGVLPASPSICNGQSVSLTASGANTYIWSPSIGLSATTGISVMADPSNTSTYIVTGTDGFGCSNTASAAVTVNALPSVGVLPASPSICNGQSVSLTASGANTYSWSPSTDLSASTGTSVTANPATSSMYTVTGTDSNGCTNTASATVTVNPLPVILINPGTPVICNGQSVLLTASGANTYSWNPSTGLSASTGTTVTANPSTTTPYVVTGTDINGCSSTTNLTVTVKSSLTITVTPPTPVICNGQSTSLTAGGANTFAWSPSNGLSSTGGSMVTANPTTTTTYKVIGTAGGCSDSTNVTVTVNSLPSIAVLPVSPAICNGQSVSLTASGGNTYTWSPSAGLSGIAGASVNANPSNTSSYIVTGTDGNGCTNTSGVAVTVNQLPTINVLPASPAICFGQSVSLTAEGGNSYAWSPSTGLSDSTGTTINANTSSTSSYIVTGTDGNGCTNTSGVTVTVNPLPSINVLPASPAICFGQSVSLNASGGNSYAWSPSTGLSDSTGTSINANPSTTSSYIVTGTDVNGCSNTASATVTVNSLPSIGASTVSSPAICFGQSIAVNASGGSTYAWNPSKGLSDSTGSSVTANPSGTSSYTVTGTDNNGCSSTASITITVNPLPVINAGPDVSICPNDSAQLSISGDPAGSNYSWTPSLGLSCSNCKNPEAHPSVSTPYIIVVTDPSGCIGSDTVRVNVLMFSVAAGPDTSVCIGNSVQLEATGGTSYQWSPSTGLSDSTIADPLAFVFSSTTYTVTISSGSCTSNTSVIVNVYDAPPTPSISQRGDTLFCRQDTSYISYQWYYNSAPIPGATGDYIVATQSGNYNVAVTNRNGCPISVGINIVITGFTTNQYTYNEINLYPNPANDYVFVHDITFQANKGATVSLVNTLGQRILVQSFGKDWNGKVNIESLAAGIYFVQIVNENEGWVGRFVKE